MATSALASPDEDIKAMSACTTDDECVVVSQLCFGWTAVNKNSEKAWDEYRRKMGPVISCPTGKETPKPASAQCVNQLCKVKE